MTELETAGFANNARAALLKFSGEKLKFADKKKSIHKLHGASSDVQNSVPAGGPGPAQGHCDTFKFKFQFNLKLFMIQVQAGPRPGAARR